MNSPQKRSRGRPRSDDVSPKSTTIQSLDRALVILKALSGSSGMSLTELADETSQSPATVYRVLCTFQSHHMVDFDAALQIWSIGKESFRIGSAFLGRKNIIEQSREAMRRLTADTGETSNLAIADGSQVIFLSQVETSQPIRAFFRPGTTGPIHASGIGKALLAFHSDESVQTIIENQGLAAFTDKTVTDSQTLQNQLQDIRELGWAIDDEERTEGMRCIAAPIFNEHGEAIAGVSISGPTVRLPLEQEKSQGQRVRACADEITRAIGGEGR